MLVNKLEKYYLNESSAIESIRKSLKDSKGFHLFILKIKI